MALTTRAATVLVVEEVAIVVMVQPTAALAVSQIVMPWLSVGNMRKSRALNVP